MPIRLLHRLITLGRAAAHSLRRRLHAATRPAVTPLAVGTIADLARSKSALVAENAFLRHQLAILHRSVARPRCSPTDRALLVLLASRIRAWRSGCNAAARRSCAGIAISSAGTGTGSLARWSRPTARPSRPRRSP